MILFCKLYMHTYVYGHVISLIYNISRYNNEIIVFIGIIQLAESANISCVRICVKSKEYKMIILFCW